MTTAGVARAKVGVMATFHQLPAVTDPRPAPMPAGLVMGWVTWLMMMLWPRAVIIAFWIFSDLLGDAYDGAVVPVLGFLLLPATTMTYAIFWGLSSDGVNGLEWLPVAIALLVDLGTWLGLRLLLRHK